MPQKSGEDNGNGSHPRPHWRGVPATLKLQKKKYHELFDHTLIEKIFEVEESVFDGNILRKLIWEKLKAQGTEVLLKTEVKKISQREVHTQDGVFEAKKIILCSYANTNQLLTDSQLPSIPTIIQETVMPLVKVPASLQHIGITIMDGGFFSLMPFPMQNCHSIHHVTLTPKGASFDTFKRDVVRFIPDLQKMEHLGLKVVVERFLESVFPGSCFSAHGNLHSKILY